jgi:hypothetical protein
METEAAVVHITQTLKAALYGSAPVPHSNDVDDNN